MKQIIKSQINHKLQLVKYKILAEQIILATFKPEVKITFDAGQYMSFKVGDKINRPYSIASNPQDFELEFLVDLTPHGPGSKFFQSLVIEENVEAMGAFGFFTLEKILGAADEEPKTTQEKIKDREQALERPITLACTGTGVAPFRSIIYDLLLNKNFKSDIYLFFGLRNNNQTYFFEEFQALESSHSNFHFIPVISKPDNKWKGEIGHCQDVIIRNPELKESTILICGATKNVMAINDDLVQSGFKQENIHYEKYG